MNRREFVKSAVALSAFGVQAFSDASSEIGRLPHPSTKKTRALAHFEQMKVGVSFHFGMNTFTGNDYDQGTEPATTYAPTDLNVDQWLASAELIGARYAILTAKHMSGFCLWDADNYEYDVAASDNHTDVVAAFVAACRKRKIVPGLYYCILDPRNEGNQGHVDGAAHVSPSYFDLILRQMKELHCKYRPIGFQLIDIPGRLSAEERWQIYRAVKAIDPHCLMILNQTWSLSQIHRGSICVPDAWPTDIILSEDAVPPLEGYNPWIDFQGTRYYMPMASWIPSGPFYHGHKYRQWFWSPQFEPRSASELFDMYRDTTTRNGSFLLNLSPDTRGLLPQDEVDCMHQLAELMHKAV